MSLIHPWMGWLALLAVIPVILHWLMRPQPKKLLFPALRLIQIRKKQNTRRLR
ncbi:MAG: BatA domain-containing protein, partial [Planctomycetaceae bacterium]|nr:BatA domain-containing protein [Planctomycetaceae bacterium]